MTTAYDCDDAVIDTQSSPPSCVHQHTHARLQALRCRRQHFFSLHTEEGERGMLYIQVCDDEVWAMVKLLRNAAEEQFKRTKEAVVAVQATSPILQRAAPQPAAGHAAGPARRSSSWICQGSSGGAAREATNALTVMM